MLFLHMLLLFVLGTSVVAIPISQETSGKSLRGILKNMKSTESLASRTMTVEERITGFWICKDKGQAYHDSILEIKSGIIMRIFPEPKKEWDLLSMLSSSRWKRANVGDVRGLKLPNDMIISDPPYSLSKDGLMGSGGWWNDAKKKYMAKLHLSDHKLRKASEEAITLWLYKPQAQLPGWKKGTPIPKSVPEGIDKAVK
ncbi:hypothetical protein F5887DRAFT_956527 [Amanita rubescens]|nr:hypothetical protein F5887DRAFT_956527 [Amanita rubescens]